MKCEPVTRKKHKTVVRNQDEFERTILLSSFRSFIHELLRLTNAVFPWNRPDLQGLGGTPPGFSLVSLGTWVLLPV